MAAQASSASSGASAQATTCVLAHESSQGDNVGVSWTH